MAETVYRGENLGVRQLETYWESDWRLISKTDEPMWLKRLADCPKKTKPVVEPHMNLPPLFAHFQKLHSSDENPPMQMKRIVIEEKLAI